MLVDLLKNIADLCPRGKALLGLDVGKKTIGVAICDPGHRVATPLLTVKRSKFTHDVEALAKVIHDYEIGGYVIGLPVNMDGSEGPRAQSVRDFALELHKTLSSPPHSLSSPRRRGSVSNEEKDPRLHGEINRNGPWIALWDERLSTVSVEDIVDRLVEKRKTKSESKSSGLVDKLAAQVILQGALDYLNRHCEEGEA